MQAQLALAERQLGRLDIASQLLPNPDRFVYMYLRQEAVLSSQIEGTQASLSELLEYEAKEESEPSSFDIDEVLNYMKALRHGLDRISSLPVSTRLLCEVHKKLTSGVRGGESSKSPGQLRKTQNWIGGTGPSNAVFVPPSPDEMQRAMSALEKFINQQKSTPLLIEIGLVHSQFETIHPFIDGNGRLGRMLITFLLCARRVLQRPLLYLSYYFKLHQQEYYDRLQAVRTSGDWEGWILFFLQGVATVAEEATRRALKIRDLLERDQARIRQELKRRAGTALNLLDLITQQPIISSQRLIPKLEVSQPTVDKLLADLEKLGILHEITGRSRGRRFAYAEYLGLFQVKY